jgi:hypothetical protein
MFRVTSAALRLEQSSVFNLVLKHCAFNIPLMFQSPPDPPETNISRSSDDTSGSDTLHIVPTDIGRPISGCISQVGAVSQVEMSMKAVILPPS